MFRILSFWRLSLFIHRSLLLLYFFSSFISFPSWLNFSCSLILFLLFYIFSSFITSKSWLNFSSSLIFFTFSYFITFPSCLNFFCCFVLILSYMWIIRNKIRIKLHFLRNSNLHIFHWLFKFHWSNSFWFFLA